MNTKAELKRLQSESLYGKILLTEARLREWVGYWGEDGVYISFSGGKDSTVLADIYARLCQRYGWEMYLVFVNTGLEYPEIQKFVKTYAEWLRKQYDIDVHLEILRPKMRFDEVIKKYGYPLISKEISKTVSAARRLDSRYGVVCRERLNGTLLQASGKKSLFNCSKYKPLLDVDFEVSSFCCDVMKKNPTHEYARKTGRKPITAQMASESRLREQKWLKNGCNGFELESPISNPMAFWTEQDVLRYIQKYNIPIASVYGEIEYAEIPEQMRFEELGIEDCGTDYLATTGCDRTGCIFCAFGCHLEQEPSRFQRLKETHPRQYKYCIGGGEYSWKGIAYTSDGKPRDIPWINDDDSPMSSEEIESFVDENKDNECFKFIRVWQPSKEGLGMGHVFDELNKIYGDGFIKY